MIKQTCARNLTCLNNCINFLRRNLNKMVVLRYKGYAPVKLRAMTINYYIYRLRSEMRSQIHSADANSAKSVVSFKP